MFVWGVGAWRFLEFSWVSARCGSPQHPLKVDANKYCTPSALLPFSSLSIPQHSLPTKPIQSFFDSTLVHSLRLYISRTPERTNHPSKHHQNAVQLRRCCFRCPRGHYCCPELYYQQRVCLNLFLLCDTNFLALTPPTVPPTVPFLAPLLLTLLRLVRLSRTPSLAVCWVLSSLLVLPW